MAIAGLVGRGGGRHLSRRMRWGAAGVLVLGVALGLGGCTKSLHLHGGSGWYGHGYRPCPTSYSKSSYTTQYTVYGPTTFTRPCPSRFGKTGYHSSGWHKPGYRATGWRSHSWHGAGGKCW